MEIGQLNTMIDARRHTQTQTDVHGDDDGTAPIPHHLSSLSRRALVEQSLMFSSASSEVNAGAVKLLEDTIKASNATANSRTLREQTAHATARVSATTELMRRTASRHSPATAPTTPLVTTANAVTAQTATAERTRERERSAEVDRTSAVARARRYGY